LRNEFPLALLSTMTAGGPILAKVHTARTCTVGRRRDLLSARVHRAAVGSASLIIAERGEQSVEELRLAAGQLNPGCRAIEPLGPIDLGKAAGI
jgi:hypothetical protein